MNARRWIASFAAFGLVLLASVQAPLAAPEAETWTPDLVRAWVLGVDTLMYKLYDRQDRTEHPSLPGACKGYAMESAIKRSEALSFMRPVIGGKALDCYVATFLGCRTGAWFGRPRSSDIDSVLRPFKRSKVTIIEQSTDRVVADLTEISYENFYDGDAKEYLGEDDVRPLTDAELAEFTDKSRYTITRGKDGHWRITDRKPSFAWTCSTALDDNRAK